MPSLFMAAGYLLVGFLVQLAVGLASSHIEPKARGDEFFFLIMGKIALWPIDLIATVIRGLS